MLPTIAWHEDDIVMVDQRKLPATEVYVTCGNINDVAKAIKTMVIRGAPAIGVCAAMGLALGASRTKATGTKQFTTEFQKNCDVLAATRPTAVNLFWAIERMKHTFSDGALAGESVDQLKARLRIEADRIHDDDVASWEADWSALSLRTGLMWTREAANTVYRPIRSIWSTPAPTGSSGAAGLKGSSTA